MDALSAPMQFLSQAEKRAKQMQEMGIEETDISDVPTSSKGSNKAKSDTSKSNSNSTAKPVANSSQPTKAENNTTTPSNEVKEKSKKGLHSVIANLIMLF